MLLFHYTLHVWKNLQNRTHYAITSLEECNPYSITPFFPHGLWLCTLTFTMPMFLLPASSAVLVLIFGRIWRTDGRTQSLPCKRSIDTRRAKNITNKQTTTSQSVTMVPTMEDNHRRSCDIIHHACVRERSSRNEKHFRHACVGVRPSCPSIRHQ